jgi:hypothetical protein
MNRLSLLILPVIALSGCASPETRLRTGLQEAGLGQRQSACMARDMADDLSLGQLIKVSKLGQFREKSVGKMSVDEFLKATRALQDPEIVKIATVAAAVCLIKR